MMEQMVMVKKEEDKPYDITKQVEKANNNEKEKVNNNNDKKFTPTRQKKKTKIKKEKLIADPKQNKPPLKSIVVYHGTNLGGDMESNKGCQNVKSKKSSYVFFNQRFVQQTSLLGIESVKTFAPKEWLNHSNGIDHPFQNKLKLAKNEAIQRVLKYRNHQYKLNEVEKLSIEAGIISDTYDSSKSVYSDATGPYNLSTEAELFNVLNNSLGTNTIWDFVLQWSWFN